MGSSELIKKPKNLYLKITNNTLKYVGDFSELNSVITPNVWTPLYQIYTNLSINSGTLRSAMLAMEVYENIVDEK